MKKLFAILILFASVACFENIFSTPTDLPSSSSSSSPNASASPVAIASPDPCDADSLFLTGKIGNTPLYGPFPLNQGVTLLADYNELDTTCPSLKKVEVWSIKVGHGKLYGTLNSTSVVLFASSPGDFLVEAAGFNVSHNLVTGEWSGFAKFEGTQGVVDVDLLMEAAGYHLIDSK